MILHLHDLNSVTGNDLIQNLIKVVQSTQVSEAPAYCKRFMKCYTIMSIWTGQRISFVRNHHCDKWPSEQRIRTATMDKHVHPKAI
jgi:hypothetical protein